MERGTSFHSFSRTREELRQILRVPSRFAASLKTDCRTTTAMETEPRHKSTWLALAKGTLPHMLQMCAMQTRSLFGRPPGKILWRMQQMCPLCKVRHDDWEVFRLHEQSVADIPETQGTTGPETKRRSTPQSVPWCGLALQNNMSAHRKFCLKMPITMWLAKQGLQRDSRRSALQTLRIQVLGSPREGTT